MTSGTEQTIVEAAILVFNEDYSAPLEKVAERAGVTRRTLHRYFAGREELLACCARDMQRSCRLALTQALASSSDPVVQLEHILYAGIDCGAKYAFFTKLHTRPEHQHAPGQAADCAEYDALQARCRAVVTRLQQEGQISAHLSADWVLLLLSGVVKTTIEARAAGAAGPHLQQFAWFSFSKGIGL
ncbi:TetR/AcrR family transcriptional regulator [Hymenobacter sp. J193]|uniref:TetR/AcrR family transcriptional regulator n=1 Tax=Hymenobacter sp. J193 TaxID=2898429 RepID=UPI0021518A05|nr:TetR/AcrR family transcriptional regulator [Hymenobacter sp. J193]MCR5889994.1 TetR/AcrR family transcriptional regulator [Hymenobacter sp. J193]